MDGVGLIVEVVYAGLLRCSLFRSPSIFIASLVATGCRKAEAEVGALIAVCGRGEAFSSVDDGQAQDRS